MDVLGGKGQEGEVARALERDGEHALMARAGAGLPPWFDLDWPSEL
jgi:hypothetical protein